MFAHYRRFLSYPFKVDQQPQRTRENHVTVEFRDGEYPVPQRAHDENHQPPFREILAIVGADFVSHFPSHLNKLKYTIGRFDVLVMVCLTLPACRSASYHVPYVHHMTCIYILFV